MLGLGVLFHVMTLLTLGLIVFPIITISMYAAFFGESDFQRGFARLRRFARRRGKRLHFAWPARPNWLTPNASAIGFCVTVSILTLGGVKLEQALDPYQMNGADGPLALQPLPADDARWLMAQEPTIRPIDKLLAFDVGSVTLAGMLADSRQEFTHGETALVQCSVIPPHEDLWVEVNLHDASGHVVERRGQVLTRDRIRTHFAYALKESLPVGEYEFVLRYNDEEIARRPVRLMSDSRQGSEPDLRQAAADLP